MRSRTCSRPCGSSARSFPDEKALVGFCGGPFTVAGYLVEGKPSRDLNRTKALMLSDPETWQALMERLCAAFATYVSAKVGAGADAIQLFDSWVGVLSPGALRGARRSVVRRGSSRPPMAPTIHFGTGTAGLLEELAAAGGDAIGLDWRVPLDVAWARVPGRAVQGNLDPAALLAPWDDCRTRGARRTLAAPVAGPATSSTSVTAFSRRPTRTR